MRRWDGDLAGEGRVLVVELWLSYEDHRPLGGNAHPEADGRESLRLIAGRGPDPTDGQRAHSPVGLACRGPSWCGLLLEPVVEHRDS